MTIGIYNVLGARPHSRLRPCGVRGMTTAARCQLTGVDAVAEAIAGRDANNLYRTSASSKIPTLPFLLCSVRHYAVVNDRIDALPARVSLTPPEVAAKCDVVDAWRSAVRLCTRGRICAREC